MYIERKRRADVLEIKNPNTTVWNIMEVELKNYLVEFLMLKMRMSDTRELNG